WIAFLSVVHCPLLGLRSFGRLHHRPRLTTDYGQGSTDSGQRTRDTDQGQKKDRSGPARRQGKSATMTNFDSDSGARPVAGPAGARGWTAALGGGAANPRARLLRGSRLVATARRAVGVRDTVLDDPHPRPARAATSTGPASREGLVRAVREVVEEA